MSKESVNYRVTLERVRDLNDKLFGGKLVMNRDEAARLIGVSASTLRRKGFGRYITCEDIAFSFCG